MKKKLTNCMMQTQKWWKVRIYIAILSQKGTFFLFYDADLTFILWIMSLHLTVMVFGFHHEIKKCGWLFISDFWLFLLPIWTFQLRNMSVYLALQQNYELWTQFWQRMNCTILSSLHLAVLTLLSELRKKFKLWH